MSQKLTILIPESELPAEGADPGALPAGQDLQVSDLLEVYSKMLNGTSLSFRISADGAVEYAEPSAVEGLLAIEVTGESGAEPTFSLAGEEPRSSVDLAAVASSVTGTFDAADGMRQLVANLASQLRSSLGAAEGAPVPLVRWYQPAGDPDGEAGGVAQLLGIWLADDAHLEALRAGGSEGIIFDEVEVEGRGLRETLTALTVLGVMMGGTLSADAGLFDRVSKRKVEVSQKVSSNRQAPIRIDRSALSDTSPSETMVIVDISKQRAYLIADGKIVVDTPVSTARSGKYTPRGEFKITQRVEKGKTSTIYGCDLPYWMRLDQSAIGMHIGDLPGYPASAGCIRLPAEIAPVMFELTKSGTTVKVMNSWQHDVALASN